MAGPPSVEAREGTGRGSPAEGTTSIVYLLIQKDFSHAKPSPDTFYPSRGVINLMFLISRCCPQVSLGANRCRRV